MANVRNVNIFVVYIIYNPIYIDYISINESTSKISRDLFSKKMIEYSPRGRLVTRIISNKMDDKY